MEPRELSPQEVQAQIEDLALVKLIKIDGNEDALVRLYNKYHWILLNVKRRSYIRMMSDEDWEQEGMLVCYEAALCYDEARGSWRSFYRVKLLNWSKTPLRRTLCARRVGNQRAISYDGDEVLKETCLGCEQACEIPLSTSYEKIIGSLTQRELAGLLVFTGAYELHEVCQRYGYKPESVLKTKSALRKRLLNPPE